MLYTQEELGYDAVAYIKLFTPWAGWTWYLTEYDPEKKIGFGLIIGLDVELGYISLEEIEGIYGPGGLKVEFDQYFKPTTLRELFRKHDSPVDDE